MISRIIIENFLSHKSTEIDLSSGLNVIVGPTDSGKSAIMRALKWVIHNRPSGDAYRSNWGGITRVTLILDSGDEVIRERGDKSNLYLLNDVEFEGFNSSVPEEIARVLDINDVNIQEQFESHFLLSKSPGEIATRFNQIAHLDKIDSSLKNVNKWLREIDSSVKHYELDLESAQIQLKRFDVIDSLESLISELETIEADILQRSIARNSINESIERLSHIDEESEELQEIIQDRELITEGLSIIDKIDSLIDEKKSIKTILITLNEIKERESEIAAIKDCKPLLNTLESITNQISSQRTEYIRLKGLLAKLKKNKTDRITLTEHLANFKTEYSEIMPDICPLCNQKVK